MLSYQHAYHAGNIADVGKHVVLLALIDYLQKKEGGIAFIDTHAGHACYDLSQAQAQKNKEYLQGVSQIYRQRPAELSTYLHLLDEYNPSGKLRYYPGSSALFAKRLRPQDRLYLSELHPGEYRELAKWCKEQKQTRRIKAVREDGLDRLKAKLPTPGRRALVLIDPAYELKEEYEMLPRVINSMQQRMPTAVFVLWYPVVKRSATEKMLTEIKPLSTALRIEHIWQNEDEGIGMNAAGLYIIRPPWSLKEQAEVLLGRINALLSPQGRIHLSEP